MNITKTIFGKPMEAWRIWRPSHLLFCCCSHYFIFDVFKCMSLYRRLLHAHSSRNPGKVWHKLKMFMRSHPVHSKLHQHFPPNTITIVACGIKQTQSLRSSTQLCWCPSKMRSHSYVPKDATPFLLMVSERALLLSVLKP